MCAYVEMGATKKQVKEHLNLTNEINKRELTCLG